MSICSSKTMIILIGTRGRQKWLEENRIWVLCGRNWWNWLILVDLNHFLTTHTWDVLNVNANRTKVSLRNTERCSNQESLLEQLKNYLGGKNLTHKQSRGHTTWKVIRKCAVNDIANWWTKRQSSKTKLQVFDWMITISRKSNLNQVENYRLVRLFFIFTTQVTTDNVVMWVTRLVVHSKTQILLVTLRTLKQPLGRSCLFLEVEYLFQSAGCARNKRQYPTVLSFRWMLDCEWMDYLLLIHGMWW